MSAISTSVKKFFFEAVSAFLGLRSAGMLVLGIHECLLCCEVFNVEPHHSSIHINSTQSFGGLIVLSCGADRRTTCCLHSSHRDPDTHVPETDFDGAFGQRGSCCMSLRSRRKVPSSIGANETWRVVIVWPELPLTLHEVQPFIRLAVHTRQQE